MSGQSIMDRVTAAKHSIAGQGLAKSVCKATTEEIIGPKKKHLDYLLQCTNEPNVSIPHMADLLIERTQHTNWVVVYKSLITIHNLMNYGNERFTQYLASNNCTFNLSAFIDKGGVQGYDMSTFIRRYAKYLNEKAVSYRQMAFDFCKVKRGKDDGLLRTMNAEKLLKTLPVLQQQLDALLEFDCTPNELTNGVINACFMLMFKDLIRLFACYNDGIINLLEKYFDMPKKQCKDALDVYKKFLVRMDKVAEFLRVAENVGIDKGDIPDLAKAPASLLDALEQHLASLEGKKGTTPPSSTAKPVGFATALNTISSNSNTFSVSEEEKKKILDEENIRLQQLKEQRLKELASSPVTGTTVTVTSSSNAQANPFSSPTSAAPPKQVSVDLFDAGSPTGPPPVAGADGSIRPSDDLLNLTGNPFVQNVQSVMSTAYPQNNPFGTANNTWQNGTATGTFTSDADFASAFNSSNSTAGLDVTTTTTSALGSSRASPQPPGLSELTLPPSPARLSRSSSPTYLETASANMGRTSPAQNVTSDMGTTGFDAFGEVMQPTIQQSQSASPGTKTAQEKLIKGDLDSSLVQLAGNLNINGPGSQIKKTQHEWKPKGDQKLTGGTNWQRQPAPTAAAPSWNAPPQYGQPMMGMQPPVMQPGIGAYPANPMGMPVAQQPNMGMAQPRPMGMGQPPMYTGMQPMGAFQQPRPPVNQQQNVNDPFGAL